MGINSGFRHRHSRTSYPDLLLQSLLSNCFPFHFSLPQCSFTPDNICRLLVNGGQYRTRVAIKAIFSPVISDIPNGLPDHLWNVNMADVVISPSQSHSIVTAVSQATLAIGSSVRIASRMASDMSHILSDGLLLLIRSKQNV